MTGVVNSFGEESCWNCDGKDQSKETCQKLMEEERAELAAPVRPSLLNMVTCTPPRTNTTGSP